MASYKCALQLTHTVQSARPEQARHGCLLHSAFSALCCRPCCGHATVVRLTTNLQGGCSSHPPAPRLACDPYPTRKPHLEPCQHRLSPTCSRYSRCRAARRRSRRCWSPIECKRLPARRPNLDHDVVGERSGHRRRCRPWWSAAQAAPVEDHVQGDGHGLRPLRSSSALSNSSILLVGHYYQNVFL